MTLTNRQRAKLGLVALRIDPDLMRIARDRAEVMAANDVMSHTEPNGQKVFDRLTAAGITWYAAGEILAWNNYPTEPLSVAESIYAWMASPTHHDIMVSTGYDYVGFGAAVSATGLRYYAGVFVKEPDETGAVSRFGRVSYASRRRDPGPRHAALVGRRPATPGHDRRAALLPAVLAQRRGPVARLVHDDRDLSVRHLVDAAPVTRSASGRATGPATGAPGDSVRIRV